MVALSCFNDKLPCVWVKTFVVAKESNRGKATTSGKGNLQMIKKAPHFLLNFLQIFHYFCILFPSIRRNSIKPQHFTMHHYSAKQHSGIIYYIWQQSHVMGGKQNYYRCWFIALLCYHTPPCKCNHASCDARTVVLSLDLHFDPNTPRLWQGMHLGGILSTSELLQLVGHAGYLSLVWILFPWKLCRFVSRILR
jgi:hypothetical protein